MAVIKALSASEMDQRAETVPLAEIEHALLESLGEGDAGPARMVEDAIRQALAHRCSDIYFEPRRHCTLLRFRIDGVLQDIARIPKASHERVVARIKVLAKLPSYKQGVPMDGRIDLDALGLAQSLRVATLPTVDGEKVVLRLIDTARAPLELDALGLGDSVAASLRDLIARPQGVLLLTGPSSSGKTTTIYALLADLLRTGVRSHVVSAEDPVEYRLDGMCQTQVNPDAGYDYQAAVRAILRQDPDVIVIGEIRDRPTAHTAIEAGLTGHLVLSTIHSGSAPGVVTRVLDMGLEPYLVASALNGALAQRLIRKNCPECAELYTPEEVLRRKFGLGGGPVAFRRGAGCNACQGLGYRGRTAIAELLSVGPAISDLVLERARTATLREAAVSDGMITLMCHGLEKVRQGVTTLEELALAVVPDED